MKTRMLMILTALFLALSCAAGAETVGRTSDGYIHRWTADNGQDIYFASSTEEAIVETDADVNFDGHRDLAVVTAMGAANTWYEFYLWNGTEYELAERWTGDIINYSLVRGKYLVSRSNEGNAGMLFRTQICVWDGNVLVPLRTMVSEEETIISWEGRIKTETTNLDRLHVTLWEQDGPVGAAETLWEKTYEPIPEDPGVFEEMEAHLWDGLLADTGAVRNEENAYRVFVYDQEGKPLEGAMIQFCDDYTCTVQVTGADGAAVFPADTQNVYEVHVLKAPEGFRQDQSIFRTLGVWSDVRIYLDREE